MKRTLLTLLCALLFLSLALPAGAEGRPYKELRPGMRDPDVAALKQRLFELGYYASNVVNEHYTQDTARFIRMFQEANGLTPDGIASPALQELFYSDRALPKPRPTPRPTATPLPSPTPYAEPAQPLLIGEYAYVDRQGGKTWFNPELMNLSRFRQVTGFSLVYRARNAVNVPVRRAEGGLLLTLDYEVQIAPERSRNAGDRLIEGFPGMRRLYVAVRSVRFAGGESLEIDDGDLQFYSWRLE